MLLLFSLLLHVLMSSSFLQALLDLLRKTGGSLLARFSGCVSATVPPAAPAEYALPVLLTLFIALLLLPMLLMLADVEARLEGLG